MLQGLKRYFALGILCVLSCLAVCQQNIKDIYRSSHELFSKGKYVEALNMNIEALKIVERGSNCYEIARGHMQVAKMYYYLKEKRRALNTYFLAKKYIDSCSIDSIRHKVYHNIGAMYTELGQADSALFYLNKVLGILDTTSRYRELAKINSVIADLHLNRTFNLKLAEEHVVKAEKFAELSGDQGEMIFAMIKRGGLLLRQHFPEKAILCYKKALTSYEEMNYTEGRLHMLKSLADVLALNRDSQALTYYSRLLALKDSIFKTETAAKIAEYETRYKTKKKENENMILSQENSLNQSRISSKNKTIIVLVISILLVIIILFWRITAMNLKKKQQELEAARILQKEKERISHDLHDNVGGQLSYVLYTLDGLNDKTAEKRKELIASIDESVRSVVANLRETIWAINDETISINDFSDRLKVYVRALFRNSETQVVFEEKINHQIQLNSLVGLNLYRICQEIANNAFKHSKACTIKVTLSSSDRLRVEILDDGHGFDMSTSGKKGYGLSNMKYRADETGILLDVASEPGKGTSYTLIV